MYFKDQLSSSASNAPADGPEDSHCSRICDVDAALARLGGDRKLLTDLASIYREDAPVLLVRISRGIREENCADVLHAAHLLRGLAANFGAGPVTERAERLEEFAIEGRLGDARQTVEQLELEVQRLEQALQYYF